jgi:hypothetical protein
MLELIAGLKSLSTGFSATKELASAVLDSKAEGRAYELAMASNKEIMEVQQTIINIQAAIFEVQQENQELKQKLKKAKSETNKSSKYTLTKNEFGTVLLEHLDKPHHFACPECKETEDKFIPLKYYYDGYVLCSNCKADYRTSE